MATEAKGRRESDAFMKGKEGMYCSIGFFPFSIIFLCLYFGRIKQNYFLHTIFL